MKQPYLKSNNFIPRLSIALLTIVTIIIVHSCRKDNKHPADQPTLTTINADIPALKAIYTNTQNNNGLKTLSTGNGWLSLIRTVDVNWDTYTLQKRKDSSIVAEFEMKNDTGIFTLKKLNLGDSIKYASRTTVTFIKFKNGMRLNFFTKIIEDLTLSNHRSAIKNVHYNRVPSGFSGVILYYSLDKQFINGYHLKNGFVDGDISFPGTGQQTKTINSIKPADMALPCTTYDVFETWCDYGGTVDDPYEFQNGCGEELIGSFTACDSEGGGGGGGSVGGDTGGSSGGSPPANPCTPATPPVNVESVSNGHLVIENLPVPPPGGGSGETTPCPNDILISNATPVKPCALKFKNITSGWMAVGVSGYKFGIQDNVFGTKIITFNLQIGMPTYVSIQQAQNATAAAMLVAEAYIAKTHGVDFFLSAGAQVTYSKEFASAVQSQLIEELNLPGVRVSNSISAGVPIITYLDNNCDIHPE